METVVLGRPGARATLAVARKTDGQAAPVNVVVVGALRDALAALLVVATLRVVQTAAG